MEDRYSEEFIIPSHLVDGSKSLGAGNILHLMQELSYHGADQLGCGEADFERRGLAWIFARMHIVINRRPSLYEKITMQTWSKGLEGLFFNRDYRFLDTQGETLIGACSSCLTISLSTRSMVRSDKVASLLENWVQNPEEAASPAGKILPCPDYTPLPVMSHRVMYSDTDFIGHVNNSQYIRWAVDCEMSLNPGFNVREITVNFIRETKLGETIEYYRGIRGGRINYSAKVEGNTAMLLEML